MLSARKKTTGRARRSRARYFVIGFFPEFCFEMVTSRIRPDRNIGVWRVRDKWTVELWDGTSLHAVVDSPVAAVRLHRELVAEPDLTRSDDLDYQQDTSG
ncbi:hypothetical protein WL78_19125 [Burkholderia ubonensis]|uniref:hypothetical protein n=1 Tax=Burkholderia ubonensis TaxID=101571 RepID=UPI00075ACE8C|nr:hypothetical protein [Burkholderia ubonensis]KWE68271.1 hypothetical protein WL78_19125 [Burkholderia ubonensis]KWF10397.1 hypothetical protein WL82_09965 [Burkholderia ubonensis]OJB47755.1 hypothetical protein BGV60_25940 [Burkholderia ubonensis]OJB52077.1 hypothetical protein BGV59_10335 [Burkholderia ubonensis]